MGTTGGVEGDLMGRLCVWLREGKGGEGERRDRERGRLGTLFNWVGV